MPPVQIAVGSEKSRRHRPRCRDVARSTPASCGPAVGQPDHSGEQRRRRQQDHQHPRQLQRRHGPSVDLHLFNPAARPGRQRGRGGRDLWLVELARNIESDADADRADRHTGHRSRRHDRPAAEGHHRQRTRDRPRLVRPADDDVGGVGPAYEGLLQRFLDVPDTMALVRSLGVPIGRCATHWTGQAST